MSDGYSVSCWHAAHSAMLAIMLDDSVAAPKLKLCTAPGVVLAEFIVDPTESSVSAITGDCTIVIDTQEDGAITSGPADHLDFCDGAGTVHYRQSCQQGLVAVAGKCVLSSMSIVEGVPVQMLSVTIPAGPVLS